jgi:hypothetical protein
VPPAPTAVNSAVLVVSNVKSKDGSPTCQIRSKSQ